MRLASRAWYAPDFLVVRSNGETWLYEVKGRPDRESRVRLKVAAETYPWWGWSQWTEPDGSGKGWAEEMIHNPYEGETNG